MADIPFSLAGATAQQPTKPTMSASGGNMTQAQLDELLAALMGAGWDGQTLNKDKANPGFLLGPSMNPINSMANFYNQPYYHRSSGGGPGSMIQPGQVPGNYGFAPGVKPTTSPQNMGTPTTPVLSPPMSPSVQNGGGVNGAPTGYGVNFLEPPAVGTGQQWRGTMRYGA